MKTKQKKKLNNIRLDLFIFFIFALILVLTLYFADGGITGAVIMGNCHDVCSEVSVDVCENITSEVCVDEMVENCTTKSLPGGIGLPVEICTNETITECETEIVEGCITETNEVCKEVCELVDETEQLPIIINNSLEENLTLNETLEFDNATENETTEPLIGPGGFIGPMAAPSVSSLVIDGGLNTTSENVSLTWDIANGDGDWVKNITNWKLNGTPIAVLNIPFENASGANTTDYSGYGTNGVAVNDAAFNATGGYDGKGAYEFDGVNDYIKIAADDIDETIGTFSVWIAPSQSSTAMSTNEMICAIGTPSSSSANTIGIFYGPASDLWNFRIVDGSGTATSIDTGTVTFNANEWHHIAATWDSSGIAVYWDGDYKDSSALTGGLPSAFPAYFYLGVQSSITFDYNGRIDEVMVFNRSLSADQIKAIYDNKTYLISSNETFKGDNWSMCITPNDGAEDGTEVCTENLTINTLPTATITEINSSSEFNTTSENITVFFTSADIDGQDTKNITDWRLNGSSIAVLNMPFERTTNGNTNATDDYSMSGNDGVEHNGVTWNATGGYDGKGAFEFDGSDDYINIADSSSLDITSEITLSVWFKTNKVGDQVIVSKNFVPYEFDLRGDNTVQFIVDNNNLFNATTVVPINTWTHIAGTYDGSRQIIYYNGVEILNVAYAGGTITTNNDDLFIGARAIADTIFDGTIDDVMIFNRALSPEQILNIYNNRTNLIDQNETYPGDNWSACITPNDGAEDGTEVCTENLTINSLPTATITEINSSLEYNTTSENISVFFTSADIDDGQDVKNITDWRLNGTSIAVLNMPFERTVNGNTNATDDYSMFGNDGTEFGGVFFNATGGYDGKGAFEFDGNDDYIDCGSDSSLDIVSSLTVSAWIKSPSFDVGYENNIVSNEEGGFKGWVLQTIGDLASFNILTGTSDSLAQYATSLETNRWYHLVGTWDGNILKIYVDGIERNSSSSNSMSGSSLNINIGRGPDLGRYFGGTIDDVMIFNRSLSSDQIKAIYDNKTYLISSDETFMGDNWSACVTPNDGAEDGTMVCSENLTVNTLPTATNVNITSSDDLNITTSNLTGFYTFTDIDEDSESDNETQWYNDTEEVIELRNNTSVHSDNTTKGQNWVFSIRVYDGFEWGSWVNSSAMTIENTPPETTQVTINATTTNNYTNESLNCYAQFADNDSDQIYANISWYMNSTLNRTNQTGPYAVGSLVLVGTLNASNTTKNDNWSCSVNAYDGTDNESRWLESSTNVTIENTPPETTEVVLNATNADNLTTRDLTCYATFADNDSDTVYANVTWYKDSVADRTNQSGPYGVGTTINIDNISSSSTTAGENWTCEVQGYDGTDYEGRWINYSSGLTIVASTTAATTEETVDPAESFVGGAGGSGAGSLDSPSEFGGWFETIEKDKPVGIVIQELKGLDQIILEVDRDLENQWLIIERVISAPEKFDGIRYTSFRIESGKIRNTLKKADIYYNVDKKWLEKQKLDRFEISLYHLEDSNWIKLPTTVIDIDDTKVYYMSTTPSFSYFLVGDKEEMKEEEPIMELDNKTLEIISSGMGLIDTGELGMTIWTKIFSETNSLLGKTINNTKLLFNKTKVLVGKATTKLKSVTSKTTTKTSAVVGKAFSTKIKPLLRDYSEYWIYGSISFILILIGLVIILKLHKKPKSKKNKR